MTLGHDVVNSNESCLLLLPFSRQEVMRVYKGTSRTRFNQPSFPNKGTEKVDLRTLPMCRKAEWLSYVTHSDLRQVKTQAHSGRSGANDSTNSFIPVIPYCDLSVIRLCYFSHVQPAYLRTIGSYAYDFSMNSYKHCF